MNAPQTFPADAAPFYTDEQCARIVAVAGAEIARLRARKTSVLDMTQDAACHLLTDVQYTAMYIMAGEDEHANLAALIDEADCFALYRAEQVSA